MNITSPWVDVPATLLQAVGQRMADCPELVKISCDHPILILPKPKDWLPRMNPDAVEVCICISDSGQIASLSERSPNVDGGWGASCMPPSLLYAALTAWLKFSESARQPDLFGAAA